MPDFHLSPRKERSETRWCAQPLSSHGDALPVVGDFAGLGASMKTLVTRARPSLSSSVRKSAFGSFQWRCAMKQFTKRVPSIEVKKRKE